MNYLLEKMIFRKILCCIFLLEIYFNLLLLMILMFQDLERRIKNLMVRYFANIFYQL